MSEEKPREGVKTENEHVDLKVTGQDGSVVQFRIKRHTPLSRLMKAYCSRQDPFFAYSNFTLCPALCLLHPDTSLGFGEGLSMRHIMFLFDGQPIKEADTPAQLEMEHDDTIEVYQQQTGGGC